MHPEHFEKAGTNRAVVRQDTVTTSRTRGYRFVTFITRTLEFGKWSKRKKRNGSLSHYLLFFHHFHAAGLGSDSHHRL